MRPDFIPKIMIERIISLSVEKYTISLLLDIFMSLVVIGSGRNM